MTKHSHIVLSSFIFLLLVAGGMLVQTNVAHAQFVPGCGGVAVTGIRNATCQAKTLQCTSAERAYGNFSPLTCPADGDPYWNDYGGCVTDPTCSNPPTTATITANPSTVVVGNSTSISWSSTNATSCSSSNPAIAVGGATSGSINVTPPAIGTYYYDVTCTGAGSPSGIKVATVSVIAPPFDASCSVNPVSAYIGQNVTWSALAWNGVAPYTFEWVGQLIDGLRGASVSIAYNTVGTKSASIQVMDSTTYGGGASVARTDDQICTGTLIASNVTGGVAEDGGTDASAKSEMYNLAEGVFYGGAGVQYNQAYASTYAAVKANPNGYCVSAKLMQACQPIGGWGGCNYTFKTDIYSGQTSRATTGSDYGDLIPNTNLGIGNWDRIRLYGVVKGSSYVGNGQIINRACMNTVAISPSPTVTAAISANPVSIIQGYTSTLTWSSTNATSCTGTNFNTGGAVSGNLSVSPSVDTTYTVTCTGIGSPAASSVTVTVTPSTCKWNYVDGSDIVDLWGSVNNVCRFTSISSLPDCAPGLSSASDGLDAPPGPPGACKLGGCDKLRKVGPGCSVPPPTVDLIAGAVSPITAVQNATVALTAGVLNIGASTSGSFPVLFQVQTPAAVVESSYVAALAPNTPASASVNYIFTAAGTYQVRACANNNSSWVNIVSESDYSNNCGPWTTVTVNAATEYPGACSSDVATGLNCMAGDTTFQQCALGERISYYNNVATRRACPMNPYADTQQWGHCVVDATCAAQPDIYVSAAPSGASNTTAGSNTSYAGSINNIGTGIGSNVPSVLQILDSSGTTNVARVAASPATVNIPVNTPQAASASYAFLSPGTYQTRFCGNMNTAGTLIIPESNYGNNCGPMTQVTVSAAGPVTTACTVSQTSLPNSGGSVTYSANPSAGVSAPYTWTPSDGVGSYGSGATATRVFTSANAGNSYGMSVTGSPASLSNCPAVAVGSSCSGTPTGTLSATPNRIKANTPTTVSFNLSAIQNVTTSCVLTGPSVSRTFSPNSCTVAGTSYGQSISLATQGVYTLTCDGVKTSSVVVNVIPKYIEF